MATLFAESVPSAHDSGWPFTPENAYLDDSSSARTNVNNDEIVYSGFNFDAIPQDSAIVGIRIRVDGDCVVGTGLVNPMFLTYVSWNAGGAYSTAAISQDLVPGGQRTSYGGNPTYLWGHAWTRSEIDPANFRVKIKATASVFSGTSEIRLDYLQVAVYYVSTAQLSQWVIERMSMTDAIQTEPAYVNLSESMSIIDTGLTLGGTAVTDVLSSDAAAFDAAARYQRTEGCVVQFEFGYQGPVMFVGDSAVVTDANDTSWVVAAAQPGLISIDSITYSGEFGQTQRPAEASIRIANKKYGDHFTGTSKYMPEHLQGKSIIGGKVTIWVMVKGTSWNRRVIFVGRILDVELTDLEIAIRATQIGTGGIPVPDITVNDNTFYYAENQYGGNPGLEGNKIPEKMGATIPIGIGRFTVHGVNSSSWPAGHLFNITTGDERHGVGIIAAMAGIKYPMMPCVAAVRNWTGKHSKMQNVSNKIRGRETPVRQMVFLFGSRKGSKNLVVSHGDPGDFTTYMFGERSSWGNFQGTSLIPIYTWAKNGAEYDQGLPFVKDQGNWSYDPEETYRPADELWQYQSAGGMDAALLGSSDWTDGEGKKAFGVFVNLSKSNDTEKVYPTLSSLRLALQVVAIPFESISTLGGWTRNDEYSHGIENTDVFNSDSMMDIKSLEKEIQIHFTNSPEKVGQASYQCKLSAPSLGNIWGYRIGGIYKQPSSTGVLSFRGRLAGPLSYGTTYNDRDPGYRRDGSWPYGWPMLRVPDLFNELEADNQHEATNTRFVMNVQPNNVNDLWGGHYVRTTPGSSARYFAWWVLSPWRFVKGAQPNYGFWTDGWVTTIEELKLKDYDARPGATQQWEFMTWGLTSWSGVDFIKYPWEVVFQCREEGVSGDGDVYLNKAWLEVVFHSQIAVDPQDVVKREVMASETSITGRTSNWFGVQHPMGYRWVQGKNLLDTAGPLPPSTDVFVSGDGPVDAAGAVIEKPGDIAKTIINHYSQAKVTTGIDVFGSFDDANSTLGSHRLAVVVDRQVTMADCLGEIARESCALIDEQITETGELKYRMFVETDVPQTDDPARIYRNDITFKFKPVDIYEEQFLGYSSSAEQLSSNIKIRYGFHLPSSTWSGEMFITKEATNLLTEGTLYQTAAANTYQDYVNLDNPLVYEFPDVWDPSSAERILKWLFNRQRRRLTTVDFTTYIRHSDLRIGHVIRIDNSMDDICKYPGEVGTTWQGASDLRFWNVLGVSYSKDVDGFLRLKVMARECYKKPS